MGSLLSKLLIHNNLVVCRAETKLTQQQLAEHIGVTRLTVIAIEKGNYNPSLELAFRIAIFFKKDIQNIFFIQNN